MNQYTAIDLFSGAGGLHIGFENAGLQAEIWFMNKLGLVRSNNVGRPAYRVGTGLCIDWPQIETSLQFFNNL